MTKDYKQEEVPSATITANQTTFWELGVNGTVIEINNQRLIIIPSEAFDLDELRVPQEWVDIPQFAGDYYLAVQVDTQENLIRIWGYTTHKQLKEQGDYSSKKYRKILYFSWSPFQVLPFIFCLAGVTYLG